MGSKKFTLIELHLDGDNQFGPRRIGEALPMLGSDVDTDDDTESDLDSEFDSEHDEDDSSGKPIGVLVGLVVLVGLAVALKKFRGGDEEVDELSEQDEPDVIVN